MKLVEKFNHTMGCIAFAPVDFDCNSSIEQLRDLISQAGGVDKLEELYKIHKHELGVFGTVAEMYSPRCAQILLDLGFKPDGSNGTSILVNCVNWSLWNIGDRKQDYQNQLEIIRLLVNAGANLNQLVKYYRWVSTSPLHMACSMCKPGTVQLLLELGANPNLLDGNHNTPLQYVYNTEHYNFSFDDYKLHADIACEAMNSSSLDDDQIKDDFIHERERVIHMMIDAGATNNLIN